MSGGSIIHCTTSPIKYQSTGTSCTGGTATVTANDYMCSTEIANPLPLLITVTLMSPDGSFNNAHGTIVMQSSISTRSIAIEFTLLSEFTVTNLSFLPGITINISGNPFAAFIIITFDSMNVGSLEVGVDFDPDDEYSVFLANTGPIGNSICNESILVDFLRSKHIMANGAVGNADSLFSTLDIQVPTIFLTGQTLVDGSDMGDIIFTVGDDRTYYETKPLMGTVCGNYFIPSDQIQNTIYRKHCPKMVTVVKGNGETLYDKLLFIYNSMSSEIGQKHHRVFNPQNLRFLGPSFADFYQNIIIYGMVRYVLARILYGDFNINYLLGKYYDKLLKDLNDSRFCWMVDFFFLNPENPIYGYNKFFKYGNIDLLK